MKNINRNFNLKALFLVMGLIGIFSAGVFAAPPVNDNFADAEQLSGIRLSVTRSNAEATKEAGEPNHANNAGGKSVWFKWTAPMSRVMAITTNRSTGNIDTMLHIYTGQSLNALNGVTFNNNINGSANKKSFQRFSAVAGTTYYFVIDGFKDGNLPAVEGEFVLDIKPSFQIEGADYDSDGMTDLAYFRPSNGSWNYIETSSDTVRTRFWGTNGDIPVVSSFAGNGRNEFGLFRPSDSTWYYQPNCCSNVYLTWGAAGDIPVPAQYGSDSGTNLAVFRPTTGEWFIYYTASQTPYYQFGLSGDIPVPGNYSPDTAADVAVFRPSDGTWYFIMRQNGNPGLDSFKAVRFGQQGDKPVPADYDGDGLLDIAVYRPADGVWYVLRSSDGEFQAFRWGIAEDVPTTGDFDGDGIFDYAVFRPSTGFWYVHQSSDNSVLAKQFGQSGDIPVTSNNGR